jgi:hypothetical protein
MSEVDSYSDNQDLRLMEKGWSLIAPGIYMGKGQLPSIGPQTIEKQQKIDYWDKQFSDIKNLPDDN